MRININYIPPNLPKVKSMTSEHATYLHTKTYTYVQVPMSNVPKHRYDVQPSIRYPTSLVSTMIYLSPLRYLTLPSNLLILERDRMEGGLKISFILFYVTLFYLILSHLSNLPVICSNCSAVICSSTSSPHVYMQYIYPGTRPLLCNTLSHGLPSRAILTSLSFKSYLSLAAVSTYVKSDQVMRSKLISNSLLRS